MTFRPSIIRVAGMVAFAMCMSLLVLLDGIPLIGRVVGWMFAVVGILIVPLAVRTWIRVESDAVVIGRLRGSRTFKPGHASVREFASPGAIVGSNNSAIHITDSDGNSVTVALNWFRTRDQHDLVRRLRARLTDEG